MVGLCKSYAKRSDCTSITITSSTDDSRPRTDYISTWKSAGFWLDTRLRVSYFTKYWFFASSTCRDHRIIDQIDRFIELKHIHKTGFVMLCFHLGNFDFLDGFECHAFILMIPLTSILLKYYISLVPYPLSTLILRFYL